MKVSIGKYPNNGTRKIKIQLDKWDTWNLDHTLALIIHPALVKYKGDSLNTCHPCLCDNPNMCTIEENICTCSDRWQEMLDKMIWAFKQVMDNDEWQYNFSSDEYHEYNNKIKEGLELFGKYYQNLWT